MKVNVLRLTRREKSHADVAKICSKNKCSICEAVKKEREMLAGFLSHLKLPEVSVTVHEECLVKMGKEMHCACTGKTVLLVRAWY